MEYSKITSVEVYNFMAYKHAKVIFDETGIINLKGYNDSGKSAMEKATAVCLMNMYTRLQSKFIKHGEDYFRVIVSFDDGISIVRDKYINGQSLYEVYKEGDCIYTTKQGNKLTKIDDVPTFIQDYLGLCMTNLGCLNFQTRDDPLWLVETKGSENYLSVNEVLKTEEIARANTLLNSDKNKLNSEIAEIEYELQNAQLLLQNYSSIKEDLLIALSEREVLVQNLLSKYNDILEISETLKSLQGIKITPELEEIDSRRLKSVLDIQKIILEIENIRSYPELLKIPYDRLKAISKVTETLGLLDGIDSKLVPVELEVIDVGKYPALSKIKKELQELLKCNKLIENLEAKEKNLQEEKDSLVEEASKQGIRFVECKNCGTLMEVTE